MTIRPASAAWADWAVFSLAAAVFTATLAGGAPARAAIKETLLTLAPPVDAPAGATLGRFGAQTSTPVTETIHPQQFDTGLGVLQSAKVTISALESLTGTVEASHNGAANIFATVRGDVTFSGTGFTQTGGLGGVFVDRGDLSFDVNCSGTGSCSRTQSINNHLFEGRTHTFTDLATLAQYAGTGTVNVTGQIVPVATASTTTGSDGSVTADMSLTAQQVRVTYSYLKHAAPTWGDGSADLVVDFGSVNAGGAIAFRPEMILNPGTADTTIGLDLDRILGLGAAGPFVLRGLHTFSDLGPGNDISLAAELDPTLAGDFDQIYTLDFSDADQGVGQADHVLTLRLKAHVFSGGGGGGGVPEPASWALLIAGFGGVGAAMRRRRVAAA